MVFGKNVRLTRSTTPLFEPPRIQAYQEVKDNEPASLSAGIGPKIASNSALRPPASNRPTTDKNGTPIIGDPRVALVALSTLWELLSSILSWAQPARVAEYYRHGAQQIEDRENRESTHGTSKSTPQARPSARSYRVTGSGGFQLAGAAVESH